MPLVVYEIDIVWSSGWIIVYYVTLPLYHYTTYGLLCLEWCCSVVMWFCVSYYVLCGFIRYGGLRLLWVTEVTTACKLKVKVHLKYDYT